MIPPPEEPNLEPLPLPGPELGGEDIEAVHRMFEQARSFKAPLQSRIRRWRQYMDMVPPDPPYEGALVVTTPVIRQKADGIRAHIQMSIHRSPFFTVKPLSSQAADVAGALEAVVENELAATDSLSHIDRAIDDAVVYGTGVLKIERTSGGYVALRYIPLSNVYVWPDLPEPARLWWFHTYYLPYWEMNRLAQAGYFRQDSVTALVDEATGSHSDDEVHPDSTFTATPEHRWHPLVEAWGILNGALVQIIYHPRTRLVLRYEVDPDGGAYAAPPFFPLHISPSTTSIWGQGIAEVLESNQTIADAMLNNELWNSQYKIAPPVFVRAGSALHRFLTRNGGGIFPRQIIPFDGPDLEDSFRVVEYGANPFNVQMLSLVNQLTEDATLSDFIVPGTPLGGRRTATEVGVTATIGQLKLSNFLRSVQHGLEAVAAAYWRAIVRTRIASAAQEGLPRGVFSVFSADGRGRVYLAEKEVDITTTDTDGSLARIYIPSAKRDDIMWRLTGSITVPERELRLSRLMNMLSPLMLQAIALARQDAGVHVLMRRLLAEMNLAGDADAILGPPPQPATPSQAVLSGFLQGLAAQPTEEETNEQR